MAKFEGIVQTLRFSYLEVAEGKSPPLSVRRVTTRKLKGSASVVPATRALAVTTKHHAQLLCKCVLSFTHALYLAHSFPHFRNQNKYCFLLSDP